LHIQEYISRIQLTYAQFEDTSDIDNAFTTLAAVKSQLVPHAQAQIVRQLLSDNCVVGLDAELARDDVVLDGHNSLIAPCIHPHQGNWRQGITAAREGRPGHEG